MHLLSRWEIPSTRCCRCFEELERLVSGRRLLSRYERHRSTRPCPRLLFSSFLLPHNFKIPPSSGGLWVNASDRLYGNVSVAQSWLQSLVKEHLDASYKQFFLRQIYLIQYHRHANKPWPGLASGSYVLFDRGFVDNTSVICPAMTPFPLLPLAILFDTLSSPFCFDLKSRCANGEHSAHRPSWAASIVAGKPPTS